MKDRGSEKNNEKGGNVVSLEKTKRIKALGRSLKKGLPFHDLGPEQLKETLDKLEKQQGEK